MLILFSGLSPVSRRLWQLSPHMGIVALGAGAALLRRHPKRA